GIVRRRGQQAGLRTRQAQLGTALATARTDARTAAQRLPGLAGRVATARTDEDSRRGGLDTVTKRRDTAAAVHDERRDQLDAVDLVIDTARKAQAREAGVQTAAAKRLPGLAHTLRAARRTAGEGLVEVPRSSVASTPARGPRAALAARSTATPAPRVATAPST
ncbi:hypothetical protein, partial [Streptomyces antarcticus]|uniref:hypothetical protein n=1 Tax=Streptomyces antarcticus TaxID=2996458 RepID=UPI0022AE59B6